MLEVGPWRCGVVVAVDSLNSHHVTVHYNLSWKHDRLRLAALRKTMDLQLLAMWLQLARLYHWEQVTGYRPHTYF
jgi:hypothetical protein